MKMSMLLAPIAAVALGAFVADHAGAVTVCKFGTEALSAVGRVVSCPSPNTNIKGQVRGNVALNKVFANLQVGAQLDVRGLNQNNGLLKVGCAARDTFAGNTEVASSGNCTPDDAGEIFAKLGYDLYRP